MRRILARTIPALVIGASIIAAAQAVRPARFELVQVSEGNLVRLDRQTGEVDWCRISTPEPLLQQRAALTCTASE